MGCASGKAAAGVINTTPKVKEGFVEIFTPSCFGGDWEKKYLVLYQDSIIQWFNERFDGKPLGQTRLKSVASHVGFGVMCMRVPNRPDLPQGRSLESLMALPSDKPVRGKRNNRNLLVIWVLFSGETDAKNWVEAFQKVLPPPPQPSHPPPQPAAAPGQVPHPGQQPVPYGFNPAVYPNGGAPPNQYGHQPYGVHQQQHQQHYAGQPTTVVVNNTHHTQTHHSNGDGFATGNASPSHHRFFSVVCKVGDLQVSLCQQRWQQWRQLELPLVDQTETSNSTSLPKAIALDCFPSPKVQGQDHCYCK